MVPEVYCMLQTSCLLMGETVNLLKGDLLGHGHGVIPGQAALLSGINGNDVAQEGQALYMQRFPSFGGLQLGAKLLDNAYIIRVLITVDHDQGMRVRLAQEVLRFINLVGSIYSDKNGAYLGGAQKVMNHWGTLVAQMAT